MSSLKPNMTGMAGSFRPYVKWVVGIVAFFVVLSVAGSAFSAIPAGYYLRDVSPTEVGIKMYMNQPYEYVGPGNYTEMKPFHSIIEINTAELPFKMFDPEVLTQDKQRIGVYVEGNVRRPGLADVETLKAFWQRFRQYYTDDLALAGKLEYTGRDVKLSDGALVKEVKITEGLIHGLAKQATKVCVGEKPFDKTVIGSARDDLRQCIEEELVGISAGYGLKVSNVMVPNVDMSLEVRQKMDAITASRLETEVATQRALQAAAEAAQEKARQEGQIKVEQARIQQKAEQDAITAGLQKKALDAQNQVITAEKANALLTAQKDKEIAAVQREVAEINAQASVATETARAKMFEANPQYANYLNIQNQSNAIKSTDKVITIPNGTSPIMSIGSNPASVVVSPPPSRP